MCFNFESKKCMELQGIQVKKIKKISRQDKLQITIYNINIKSNFRALPTKVAEL